MKYFFRHAEVGTLAEVKDYYTNLYDSLIENFPSARDILAERYDNEELENFDDSEKIEIVKDFIDSWSEHTADLSVFDENGNILEFEELQTTDYFDVLDKLEDEYVEKARRYYSGH